jgi:ankyrin repeat protein
LTPLLEATRSGHADCVRLLLHRGASKRLKSDVRPL